MRFTHKFHTNYVEALYSNEDNICAIEAIEAIASIEAIDTRLT